MNSLFKIAGSICITTYILGLLTNLVDLNYTHKSIRLTFALYFLTAVLVPLKDIEYKMPTVTYNKQEYQASAHEYIFSNVQQQIESDISDILREENILYTDFQVYIATDSSGTHIEYVQINGAQAEEYQHITSLLNSYGKIIFGE